MSLDSAINSLVTRLEAVTKRLESVEKQLVSGGGAPSAPSHSTGGGEASSASVQEYEDLVNQFIKPYVDLSNKMGDKLVAEQASLVLAAVNAQRNLLQVASLSKKPADNVLQSLVQPTSDLMNKINGIKDSNRASKFFNQLSAVAEGIQALGWVVVSPTPGPYVADMRGGSEFYSNRILKEFKGVDQNQVDWVANFNNFLKELQAFIKKNHTTGLTWNARGGDASAVAPAPSSEGSSGGPPPPGPPPPPVVDMSGGGGGGPDMSKVFASLNQGVGVSSGLKKVTADQKTKNRTDKSSVVPATAIKEKPVTTSTGAKTTPTKPPKLALEGNKWCIENQIGNKNIVISDTELKQTIYIYRCQNSTIQVKGKVNSISMDDCKKVAVVFENLLASFEVVNCSGLEVQVTGKVPSFAIDKTSGCQLYLSKESLNVEIVSSKSSEMNVSFADANDELVEYPIPEQYKTVVKNYKLHTETVQHV